MKKKKAKEKHETSPVRHLQLELQELRRELRTTARVYAKRLEHDLILTTAALDHYAPAEKLNREQLHRVRDFANHGAPATTAARERTSQGFAQDREPHFRAAAIG
jgi:hypothetical protein